MLKSSGVVMGSINRQAVLSRIRDYSNDVKDCAERASVPSNGEARIAAKWNADGSVSSPILTQETTLSGPVVAWCIELRAAEWRFPKPHGGGIGVITGYWDLGFTSARKIGTTSL